MPTMRDVAERAGVSIKTVSNVLNDYPYIRPETRDRVEAAITELGYQVNVTARNLRRGMTGVIGLALPELSLPYFAELADAVMDAGDARGLTVVIERTSGTRERELDVLHGARRSMTDGLIFSPLALGQADEPLLPDDVPLVILGERIFTDRFDHVTMSNVDAARAATRYLLDRGRRRIAPLGVHPGESVGSAALRLRGFQEALAEAGVPDDPLLHGESYLWHRGSGAQAMAAVLDRGGRPDAVFGLNDALALGAMHELQARGLRVPDDVAVIGFDDVDEAQYSAPPLTTVNAGRTAIAETAVAMLLERVADKGATRPPRRVTAPFTIVERLSVGERPADAERWAQATT